MDSAAPLSGDSSQEQPSTQHTDIVTTKDENAAVVKIVDANQNTENTESLPQTTENGSTQLTEEKSSVANPDSVAVDNKICMDNNEDNSDQENVKCENVHDENIMITDTKPSQEDISVSPAVLEDNCQASDNKVSDLTVESSDIPPETSNKGEEVDIELLPSKNGSGDISDAIKDGPKETIEGEIDLQREIDHIEGSKGDSAAEKRTESTGQIDKQTTAITDDKNFEGSGNNAENAEEIDNQGSQSAGGVPGPLQPGDNSPPEIEGVVPETVEATEQAPSSTDPQDKDQPTEPSTNTETQGTIAEPSSTRWYTDEVENEDTKSKAYSTSMQGGVVVQKPLPSRSSPETKRSPSKNVHGSKFKMSFGSIFKRRKSQKDKTAKETTTVNTTPEENETDGVKENDPLNKGHETEHVPTQEENRKSEIETSTVQEPSQPVKEVDEEKSTQGEIVPLEEGVAKTDLEPPKQDDESQETPTDEDSILRERIAKRESLSPTNSPEKHMQMRVSYVEGSKAGEKEIEVIGTREVVRREQPKNVPDSYRYSCRELGDVDHEGWLAKRGGGAIFAPWKRKWVVLKERHLYYYKTAFDLEAGGVAYLDEHHTATAAPEVKRKFAFRIESDSNKAKKLLFAADNQDDMAKWLAVLSAASRGEPILRKTCAQSTSNVKMRKKNSSVNKRCGSVLGIGGVYEYDGNIQRTSPSPRRASFGSSPKEGQKPLSLTAITSNEEDKTQKLEAKETIQDKPPEKKSHGTLETAAEAETKIEEIQEVIPRESVSTMECSSLNEVQSDPVEGHVRSETGDTVVTEKEEQPCDSATDGDEQPTIAPLEQVAAVTDAQKDECSTETKETQEDCQLEDKTEARVTTPMSESKPETKETQEESQSEDKTDHPKEHVTTPMSESKPETQEESHLENETDHSEARVTTPMSESKPETNETQEDSQSEDNTKVVEAHVTTPMSESKMSSSNTTWYFILDVRNDSWVEYINKPKHNDDELLSLVRTIKDARITITGTPLPGNEERLRAMTSVSSENAEVLKLRELKRSLKDKERDIKALDELLTQNIDRKSIYEWSAKYPYLKEDVTGEVIQDNDSDSTSNEDPPTPQEQSSGEKIGEADQVLGGASSQEETKIDEKRTDTVEETKEKKEEEEIEETTEKTEVPQEDKERSTNDESPKNIVEPEQENNPQPDNADDPVVQDKTTGKEDSDKERLTTEITNRGAEEEEDFDTKL